MKDSVPHETPEKHSARRSGNDMMLRQRLLCYPALSVASEMVTAVTAAVIPHVYRSGAAFRRIIPAVTGDIISALMIEHTRIILEIFIIGSAVFCQHRITSCNTLTSTVLSLVLQEL